jgi:DNA-directed RNA polymerase subunit RPC12/RpoP
VPTEDHARLNITVITCRGCGRKVERERHDNSLVGQQARLRCTACGHRGADLIVTWKWAERPEQ